MGLFFIRLAEHNDRYTPKSITFECEHDNVADLTRALAQSLVAGQRCEWRWNNDRSSRTIISRTGMTLSAPLVATIAEPPPNAFEDDGYGWSD